MKTIGLLGGMSWESTILYYQFLNLGVRERLGGLHSAKLLMHNVDFAEIERCQVQGEWQRAGEILGSAAAGLEAAGAELMLICTNLMHKVAPLIEEQLNIPLLHIADGAGRAIAAQGLTKVGLLGAIYTMEEGFYRDRLQQKFGIEVVIPPRPERELVHRVIFEELCRGEVRTDSKAAYLNVIEGLKDQGAEGVILGCTEIPLLVKPGDTELPLFNTTELHAAYALEESFASSSAAA